MKQMCCSSSFLTQTIKSGSSALLREETRCHDPGIDYAVQKAHILRAIHPILVFGRSLLNPLKISIRLHSGREGWIELRHSDLPKAAVNRYAGQNRFAAHYHLSF